MNLDALHLGNHEQCEALTAALLAEPSALQPSARPRPETVVPGAFLWRASDVPRDVFLLQSGRIDIAELDSTGNRTLVQIVAPGQIFGYLCFCDHRNEPHGTEARGALLSNVLRSSYHAFQLSLRRSSASVDGLVAALCTRTAQAERRARMLAAHQADRRLAMLLLQLCQTARQADGLSHVTLRFSQAELAELAALTRPHTTVLLTRFRAAGLVRYTRGKPLEVHSARLQQFLDGEQESSQRGTGKPENRKPRGAIMKPSANPA